VALVLMQASPCSSLDLKAQVPPAQSSQSGLSRALLIETKGVYSALIVAVELCILDNLDPNCPVADVAVKRLKLASFRKRQDLQRFFQEGAMLRRIQHR
jgi:hypothetical protein